MLTLPPSVRIFVCLTPADMRRSLDGLAALTREILQEDPLSGHLFVFFNRRRDRTKILFWDRSGLCLYYKRIEREVWSNVVDAAGSGGLFFLSVGERNTADHVSQQRGAVEGTPTALGTLRQPKHHRQASDPRTAALGPPGS